MELKGGCHQMLNTRAPPLSSPLPVARPALGARRAARAASKAAPFLQGQQQLSQQQQPFLVPRAQHSASKAAVSAGAVVEPAAVLEEEQQQAPAAQQARPQPQVADLETILQERDACGVGFIAHLRNLQSHTIVEQALQALGCMEHRGACSADDDSGDGAGIMTQVPWKLLQAEYPQLSDANSGVGMIFLPNDDQLEAQCKAIYEDNIAKHGMQLVAWRQVPVKNEVVGRFAKATQPRVWQVLVNGKPGCVGDELERELFVLRKAVEAEKDAKLPADKASDFYTCSLSNKTIIYKGMLRSVVVGQFYQDLKNPEYVTSFAIYHRRFSTNTTPKWPLAQPMRVLGHNGEINTLQGNLNWVASREREMTHPIWAGRDSALERLTSAANSDSANLDSVAEVMVRTGMEPSEALMVLVPEAYRNHPDLVRTYPEAADFYEYWEGIQEGWDGPALLVFSDGKKVGARLDRNGLRPARFWQTKDDMIYVASEVGVLNNVLTEADQVVAKGRLGPGQMVVADLEEGSFMQNTEVSKRVASRLPYKDMLKASLRKLSELSESSFLTEASMDTPMLLRLQGASGLGQEDAQMVVEAMAQTGNEATYCMGDDIPLSVLSDRPHPLYNYFKQRFAQVTNPPIDPLREGLVMSMEMRLGKRGSLLQPDTVGYRQVALESPILLESELNAILNDKELGSQLFKLSFEGGKEGGLEAAIASLNAQVEAAVKAGCQCVVLSDRADPQSLDPKRPPIPALLAVGAVHHHLIRSGLRSDTSIVIDTLSCYTTHHAALLVGYGAHAICPHLAYETARQWRLSARTQSLMKAGKAPSISVVDAQKNLKKSLEKGIMKILSKMGISLLQCYHGAQIFEAYGLGPDVVDTCFRGSVSRIGGMSLADLQREAEMFWVKGFPDKPLTRLEDYGFIQSKPRGEYHANNQAMAKLMHKAIGLGKGSEANQEAYAAYQEHFEQSPITTLRDCLEYNSDRQPIDISEVEPVDKIMARFCTGGMSLGAISRETHETIAIAMNRVGGKSNSGEGGEDPGRWLQLSDVDESGMSQRVPYLKGLRNGDIATSRIKQVASGRFGVTPEFAVNADQLEIKIAQGAKPGEGGQLPGGKVSPYIADLRRSKPGVPLISPPPHHDIYSIEDLAQLIHDLHQVNPYAKVSVKLVAEAGIGVVASGVAKANADIVQVSGHDGGTGASPISSIKHAGGPMEMGLVETHQVLVRNELRDRIIVRTDGGIRSGRDIMMAALLGADEYGFGTAAMIATGCIMARVCHTNNCPVGVATQREELRARFPGTPADLVNYFHFVAEEVRADMARLGYRSMDEIIGRADLLRQRPDLKLSKTSGLDLSYLTTYWGPSGLSSERINQPAHSNGSVLDDDILADPEIMDAIKNDKVVRKTFNIVNVDRSALARVSGAIAKQHGNSGFLGSLQLTLQGSAGQSFACFNIQGMDVHLVGEANDYVGKSMSGGDISIVPPPNSSFQPETGGLAGNTCLYGATGGRLFVNGRTGERFAVRNSMAEAVIEGAGDHCCEYMTGGTVVVLGPVGRNVAAGMTGGLGFFLDEDGTFTERVNTEIVAIQRVITGAGALHLKELIQTHVARTGSPKGKAVLENWDAMLPKFWQLVPPAEKNTPEVNPEVMPASEPAQGQAAVSA